ncbi:MAG: acyltransferase [Thiotrichaceae bacterium]
MIYRKEIDGLRAFAVIPVILYHAGFEWLKGGYIGVDIFFVISGYLITSIIIRELEAGTFTITNFYERRARRILPALFFIILVCLPFAWYWLLPFELKDFGKSMVAVTVFASNILFWQESDYFAAGAELIPLLHTWSLAVEEQFYVFFPLLMMFLWAFGKRWLVAVIAIIGLLSLGLTEWGWRHFPEANFYLIPTRAWELMIGALLAFYLYYKDDDKPEAGNEQRTTLTSQLASITGFALIIASIFFLDKSIPFPSLYALAPTLGTALIILFTTPDSLVYRVLSLRLLVGIGLISYSAYLWHQPLFVFTRMMSLEEPSQWLLGLLSMVTFLLAYLSWRFVEKPFRNKQRFSRKQIFIASLVGSLIMIGIGVMFIATDGEIGKAV